MGARADRRFVAWTATVLGGLGLLYLAGVNGGCVGDTHPNPRPMPARVLIGAAIFVGGLVGLHSTRKP